MNICLQISVNKFNMLRIFVALYYMEKRWNKHGWLHLIYVHFCRPYLQKHIKTITNKTSIAQVQDKRNIPNLAPTAISLQQR